MKFIDTIFSSRRALIIAGVCVVGIAAIVTVALLWQPNTGDPYSPKLPSLVDTATLEQLASKQIEIDTSHLADGLIPPTNKWYSGIVLQAEPKPVFNYPNSFKPSSTGFEFSLPKVSATDTLIAGPHAPDVIATIQDADHYKVTQYDELSVELTYYDASEKEIATVRVASGLPYVYIQATQDASIRFTGDASEAESATKIRSNGTTYGLSLPSTDNQIMLSADSHASFFSVPDDKDFTKVLSYADNPVESGAVSYAKTGDNFRTTFSYKTTNNKPVLFARLPHQQAGDASEATYSSILGDLTTESGNSFSYETAAVPVVASLDLSGVTGEQKSMLLKQLQADLKATTEPKPDTYFGGKQLFRTAQLLDIAEQLGDEALSKTAKDQLKKGLKTWLQPGKSDVRSFLYSSTMNGIVGNEASFGSDKEFNDHHFHYGYFIYSAAILAKYDSEFLESHRKMVDLLVADIANYNIDEPLPLRRSFDAYAGHSWASGTSPFADGNNQESTSEALNAWIGASLWAERTDNAALALEADWMLSNEYTTANLYWLGLDTETPDYLAPYDQPLYSLVWGAKREYATFFSDEPNAKLAIQLLPLTPTLRASNDLPKELFKGTSTSGTYGDHILMATPGATLEQGVALPDTAIDDGNSRTYLYAYLLAQ